MPEIKKHSLREKLREADEKYKGDPALVGSSGMTFGPYNNSTRTNMLTSHMNQFLNILYPEFPYVFAGMENVAGKNSSGYLKLDHDIEIFRKVVKYEELVDTPYVYQLFYWDKELKMYDVVERTEVEDLGQDFGYKKNNEKIDMLDEGDEVDAGTVLFKSQSYNERMLYRYGANFNVAYTFDPGVYEDAGWISERVQEICKTTTSVKKVWRWSHNAIPINVYGDDDEYRPLPWIGEEVNGIIASSRLQINEQILYDLKHDNLNIVKDTDKSIFYNGNGVVVDYEIYCNDTEIKRNRFNAQLLMLIDAQNRYWKRIQDVCIEIKNSGKKYSHDVDLLYKKSTEYLERNERRKWNNGCAVFGNIEIRAHIVEYPKLSDGGKFTARYGNKSVVARVLPVHMMPFTADGTVVDILLPMPAVPNRTTGFVFHEMHITWLFRCARRTMASMKTRKEKEELLWDLIKRLNVVQYEKFYTNYKTLSDEEKDKYIESCITRGIYTHQDMINEDESIFFKLKKAQDELEWAKPDTLYVYRYGHVYRMYQDYYLGSMYMFPLKQTDKRQFSVRATGAINLKGLPERSYKNKRGEAPFSDTAIRFGEYEALTMLIALLPDDLVAMQAAYRTSPEASEDLTRAQFDKKCRAAFKKYYKSRPAEIVNVYFRHLGVEPTFIDLDSSVGPIDFGTIREHTLHGKTYLCTDYDFHCIEIRERIREEILLEHPVINAKELEEEIERRYKESPVLSKEYDGSTIFGDEVLAEPEVSSVWEVHENAKADLSVSE